MPMIDVDAPSDLFPDGVDREIAEHLTMALLRAEGVQQPAPRSTQQHGRIHLSLESEGRPHRRNGVRTDGAGSSGHTARALNRTGQRSFVAEATAIVARIAKDPTQAARTWVLLAEAAEGGWRIAVTAFGREEFAALAKK